MKRNRIIVFISRVLIVALFMSCCWMYEGTTTVKADSSVVERAISWAISIANDNSHGYSLGS